MEATKMQNKYSDDAKVQAVKMVKDGGTINGVARSIGVNRVTLKKWINKYGANAKKLESSAPEPNELLNVDVDGLLLELQSIAAQLRSNDEKIHALAQEVDRFVDRRTSIWLFIGIAGVWMFFLFILYFFATF